MNLVDAQAFLAAEARMLDEGRLDDWLALTTEDVVYWVPVNEDDASPDTHLSIVYDDRARLSTRIWRIAESNLNHTQEPPSRSLRMIANVEVESAERADEVVLRCNATLYTYRAGAQRRDLALELIPLRGTYRLRRVGNAWKIAFKKVSLLAMDANLGAMTFLI